jgi:carboxylesterase type B
VRYDGRLSARQGPETAVAVVNLDLVLALNWGRGHIEQFGGGPKRVLIFGQSGDGAKLRRADGDADRTGHFHRVIAMSSQRITASQRETATARSLAVIQALRLPTSRIDELRTMPMQRLIDVSPGPTTTPASSMVVPSDFREQLI